MLQQVLSTFVWQTKLLQYLNWRQTSLLCSVGASLSLISEKRGIWTTATEWANKMLSFYRPSIRINKVLSCILTNSPAGVTSLEAEMGEHITDRITAIQWVCVSPSLSCPQKHHSLACALCQKMCCLGTGTAPLIFVLSLSKAAQVGTGSNFFYAEEKVHWNCSYFWASHMAAQFITPPIK